MGVWLGDTQERVAESIDLSLKQLQLEQVDLMLIHNPASSISVRDSISLTHPTKLTRSI
eukprot:COSAG06_NODE_8714_length_2090_cov_1.725264_2_plen_59_part_00